jgi:hypothetical protein
VDEGVIVVVVFALPTLAPNTAAKTSMVAPPNHAIAVLASDLIRLSILHRVVIPPPCPAYPYLVSLQVRIDGGTVTFISTVPG